MILYNEDCHLTLDKTQGDNRQSTKTGWNCCKVGGIGWQDAVAAVRLFRHPIAWEFVNVRGRLLRGE